MENNYCEKCGACCKYIKVDFEKKILFRDGIQPLTADFESMLEPADSKEQIIICRCKYLENNLCTNPQKPQECVDYPSSAFAFLPENCGYTGLIFLKLEKLKCQIRKLKEEVIHYEAMIETTSNKFERNQLEKIIKSHKAKINKYHAFGSEDW